MYLKCTWGQTSNPCLWQGLQEGIVFSLIAEYEIWDMRF